MAGSKFVEWCYILFFYIIVETNAKHLGYKSLGCWSSISDRGVADVIPSVEDLEDDDLDSLYWERDQAVLKCAWFAKDHGYQAFAIRNSGECLTSANASRVYRRFGQSTDCRDGEGGHGAMNVYRLKGKLPEIEEFEGDIMLTKLQKAMTMPIPFGDVVSDSVFKKIDDKWPERTIPYFIHPKYQNHQLARKALDGIKPWLNQTCINFIPKKNHRDWVELVREKSPKSRRCASAIGHIGGKQQMRLGDLCPAGSVIHEWGHSIGLWHTHSRSDRDKYIKVLWNNIFGGWKKQFEKRSMDTYGVKYDYMSIMHYGKNFFAKVSKDKTRLLNTIKTFDSKYQDKIGQREYLSEGDVDLVNTMYGCPDFPFMWRSKDWGECSKDCGPGTQTRDFICAKDDGKKVSDAKCQNSPRPESKRTCYGKKCSDCPSGWYKYKQACFQLQLKKAGWKKARKTCKDNGADLVILHSKVEEEKLRGYIKEKVSSHLFFWIGALYNPTDGVFKWVDDTSIQYSAWKKGEPRFGMDCAILFVKKDWGTDQCSMGRSFVCKKELRDYVKPDVKETDQLSEYRWYAGSWGECSVTCGGGQKNRKTYCAGKDGVEVHYSKCTGTPPDAWKDCNKEPCPSPYKWHIKEWQKCSVTCGGGWQRREVICAKEDMLSTAYEMCNHTKQPDYQQKCNTQPCPPKDNKPTSKPTPAPPAPPAQPQWPAQTQPQWPAQTQPQWPAQTQPQVPTQTQTQPQWPPQLQPKWKASHWSHCTKTCGKGRQLRHVVCMSRNGKKLHDKRCFVVSGRKPIVMRSCRAAKKCPQRKAKRHCRDENIMCHFWRRRHQCHSQHVRKHCKRSCRVC